MTTIAQVIPTARPDHISLDFDRLRAEGIRHLENLATELWTDFNAHDPGITLLELLCYGITDLGYRTRMLPIEDITTPGEGKKIGFAPQEILPGCPVTERDFRKILIDLEGVKNAWLERCLDPTLYEEDGEKFNLFARDKSQFKIIGKIDANGTWSADSQAIADFLKKFYNPENVPDGLQKTVETMVSSKDNWQGAMTDLRKDYPTLADAIECKFIYKPVEVHTDKFAPPIENGATTILLNGLYKIILELDDDVDLENPEEREKIIRRALDRLHANRSLCEDFYLPIGYIKAQRICLCLDLDMSPEVIENEVLASVIFRLQEYLTPTLRFRNFLEMRDLGYSPDQIFNGPLLRHGFLDAAEMDAAQRREVFSHSDMLQIILETPGVTGVRDFKLKNVAKKNEPPAEDWPVLDTNKPHDFSKENLVLHDQFFIKNEYRIPTGHKAVIDHCCSKFCVRKGPRLICLEKEDFDDAYEALRYAAACDAYHSPGYPTPPGSQPRADLAEYRSLQYDLPSVYHVGDNRLPDAAAASEHAAVKQLQAYLAFFDQILGSYLAQLAEVRYLLSADQDSAAATQLMLPMYDIPGVRELIGAQAKFEAKPTDWAVVINRIPETKIPSDATETERKKVETALASVKGTTTKYEAGFGDFRQKLDAMLGPELAGRYAQGIEDYFWEKYAADPSNNYMQELRQIAESPAAQQARKNRLLDHLIARFGEAFSDYILTLVRPDAAPEDNPWHVDFSEYLHDKANFLKNLPALGGERSKGYNYADWQKGKPKPNVWDTTNVSGLQKRICALMGFDTCLEQSLLPHEQFHFEIFEKKPGKPPFVILMKKGPSGQKPTGAMPTRDEVLMFSEPFSSKEKLKEKMEWLFQNASESMFYEQKTGEDFVGLYPNGTDQPPLLRSETLEGVEVERFLKDIKKMVAAKGAQEVEGMHIVEHILLRPNDACDRSLLCLPLGCNEAESPADPYSFWITVALPGWTKRFSQADFRQFFEERFRFETPAHIAIRFCYLDEDTMREFEMALRKWRYEKAATAADFIQSPSCSETEAANRLIDIMNRMDCACFCAPEEPDCGCDAARKPCNEPDDDPAPTGGGKGDGVVVVKVDKARRVRG